MKENPTFLLVPDSFKDSMTAYEVCEAIEKGIRHVFSKAICYKIPMADGGEGTVDSLIRATGGKTFQTEVTGPLAQPVKASYGLLGDNQTAVIEMAAASGFQLIKQGEQNPLKTTTYGTGELLKVCMDQKISRIIIGIGGSATNDGGAGFAQALGARLLDGRGIELPFGGEALSRLAYVDIEHLDKRLKTIQIDVACDVSNPLCGPNGASAVFGPQKGANQAQVQELDKALFHFSQIVEKQFGIKVAETPGAGAAGGLGFGLLAFTAAQLSPGIDLMVRYTHLTDYMEKADYVITGEGRIDAQTRMGKTPYGIAQLAKMRGKPLIAIAGQLGNGYTSLYDEGFTAIHSILPHPMPLEEALSNGTRYVEETLRKIAAQLQ